MKRAAAPALGILFAASLLGVAGGRGGGHEAAEARDLSGEKGVAEKKDTSKDAPKDDRHADAKRFVDLLAAGDFATAVKSFDETMAAALPVEKLAELWKTLNAQAGPYKKQTGIRSERDGDYLVVFVTCQFEKTALDAKIAFDSAKKIAGLFFVPPPSASRYEAPDYARPSSYREIEVRIGPDAASLPATLAMPAADGSVPGVVLVHGSGPLDRDETIGPNKPFRDLALGLASRGVAVLRYDKRTFARAAEAAARGDRLTFDEETVDDAVAALRLLRASAGVDPHRVFVLGHSLGGVALPRVAVREPGAAGFIMLATPSRPLEEVYRDQMAYLASLDGTISTDEREGLETVDRQVARVRSPASLAAAHPEDLPLGLSGAYWSDLRREDARGAVSHLRGRSVLILQGDRDYQSTAEDLAGWRRLLEERPDVGFKLYPGLNHLFMAGSGPIAPAEYETAGHVAAAVVDDLAAWIRNRPAAG